MHTPASTLKQTLLYTPLGVFHKVNLLVGESTDTPLKRTELSQRKRDANSSPNR
jgi:hypothetical protein